MVQGTFFLFTGESYTQCTKNNAEFLIKSKKYKRNVLFGYKNLT